MQCWGRRSVELGADCPPGAPGHPHGICRAAWGTAWRPETAAVGAPGDQRRRGHFWLWTLTLNNSPWGQPSDPISDPCKSCNLEQDIGHPDASVYAPVRQEQHQGLPRELEV